MRRIINSSNGSAAASGSRTRDSCSPTGRPRSSGHEELFDADLNRIGPSDNHVGDLSGFAPPGDIHRVHNTASTTAISIHIYGTDVTRDGFGRPALLRRRSNEDKVNAKEVR